MSSLPLFDPGPMSREGPPELSVSELTAIIKEILETGFPQVAVQGEISNLSRPRSGHVYFSLKDAGASIRAVLWKGSTRNIRFDLQDGLAVTAWGELSVYPPQGVYQVVVRRLEPIGIGSLELAFRQMHDRLKAEGLFEASRKRPLPRFPRRVIVVTSPTGAAVRDFLQTIGRRWPVAEVLIAPAKMQGMGSAEEVVEAISLANRVEGADLIALVRGGGSAEDLWTFNEEKVARAVAASALPVITGIGHEVDVTIADLVADVRGLTPTDAAVHAVPDRVELLNQIETLGRRLAKGLSARTDRARHRIDRAGERLAEASRQVLASANRRLQPLEDRLNRAWLRDLERRGERLASLAGRLEALSPLAVLARGYSLTLTADGNRVVRDASTVHPGDLILTRLAAGQLLSRVESRQTANEAVFERGDR